MLLHSSRNKGHWAPTFQIKSHCNILETSHPNIHSPQSVSLFFVCTREIIPFRMYPIKTHFNIIFPGHISAKWIDFLLQVSALCGPFNRSEISHVFLESVLAVSLQLFPIHLPRLLHHWNLGGQFSWKVFFKLSNESLDINLYRNNETHDNIGKSSERNCENYSVL